MKSFITLSLSTLLIKTISAQATSTSSGVPAQVSPTWLNNVTILAGNVNSYPTGNVTTGPLGNVTFDISAYPTAWASPPADSPEVKAVMDAIDWSKVPNSPVRKADNKGDLSMSGYDNSDPDCWWSATGCVVSKNPLIPPDAYACPQTGYWGLTYDDGPLTASDGGEWAEPQLYDFLAEHNQKASLFYIGSNVIAAPAAAQRALADGHTICVHTWSHPAMTSQSNASVVAELYWTIRAIKEVTGVTTKCWRPPYGDVDDRVRAIAWQMGLTTVLWDEDTDDWNMPGEGGGNLSPETVDGYFENWLNAYKNGTDNKSGHIVLQHELNNATVSMAEKWLPQVQSTFKKVVPWNYCYNISQPYWETNFVYPTSENPNGATSNTTNSNTTNTSSAVTTSSAQESSSESISTTNNNVTPANSASRNLLNPSLILFILGLTIINF